MQLNLSKVLVAVTAVVLFSAGSAFASEMDSRIEATAKDSYVFKTYLQNDSVAIKSTDGVVVLSGTVNEESHKSLAKDTVEGLPGVKSVENTLTYNGERHEENSDGWIGTKVKTSLLFNRNVSGLKTDVLVKDGFVTLRGDAENQAQKDLTGEYAKDIAGVKGVNNEMSVVSPKEVSPRTMAEKMDDASIVAQVKMALMTRRSTNAFKTSVECRDGVVTLRGHADSEAGKSLVTKVANDVGGVVSVDNQMAVEN